MYPQVLALGAHAAAMVPALGTCQDMHLAMPDQKAAVCTLPPAPTCPLLCTCRASDKQMLLECADATAPSPAAIVTRRRSAALLSWLGTRLRQKVFRCL